MDPALEDEGYDRLLAAGVFFAVAVVLHNADHVRRGADAVEQDVFWIGTAAVVVEVALVVLICWRHRLAPVGAAVTGLTLAAGYVFVHFLPERQWLSDPLVAESGVDAWSITAASIEVVAALVLGIVGLVALRRSGGVGAAAGASGERSTVRQALLHPVALAFAITQACTLAISFAQV